jgi:hypothetical protein
MAPTGCVVRGARRSGVVAAGEAVLVRGVGRAVVVVLRGGEVAGPGKERGHTTESPEAQAPSQHVQDVALVSPSPMAQCPGPTGPVSQSPLAFAHSGWAGGGEHIKLKVSKNPAVGLRAPGRAEVGDSGLLPSYTLPSAGGRGGGLGPPLPRLGWIGLRGAVPGWHRAAGSQMRLSALQSSLFLLYSTRLGRPQAFCSI